MAGLPTKEETTSAAHNRGDEHQQVIGIALLLYSGGFVGLALRDKVVTNFLPFLFDGLGRGGLALLTGDHHLGRAVGGHRSSRHPGGAALSFALDRRVDHATLTFLFREGFHLSCGGDNTGMHRPDDDYSKQQRPYKTHGKFPKKPHPAAPGAYHWKLNGG